MLFTNNFSVRPFSPEDRLFILSGGTLDLINEATKQTKQNLILLDSSDTDLIREIHSKTLHFLQPDVHGEVFHFAMNFLEALFKCLWEGALHVDSVSEAAEKLALEASKFSQFRMGEPIPTEVIQFALS